MLGQNNNLLGTLKNGGQKSGQNSILVYTWVGIATAILLSGISVLSLPKAHAADRSWGNIETAKKAIENVAPVISESKVDQNSASYVFASENFIQKPLVVETQITVDPPKPKVITKSITVKKVVKPIEKVEVSAENVSAHRFPYGYCTYFVSQQRFVPWSGNAISWLSGAKSFGYATGNDPQTGAIMVTSEGGRTGHVAMVNSVNSDGTITISEMNYAGWGVTSSRTIPEGYGRIMGYIY